MDKQGTIKSVVVKITDDAKIDVLGGSRSLESFENLENALDYCVKNGLMVSRLAYGGKRRINNALLKELEKMAESWSRPGKNFVRLSAKIALFVYRYEIYRAFFDVTTRINKPRFKKLNRITRSVTNG